MHTPPPSAKQIPVELTLHGETRIDPYFWLNQRENPDVLNYLQEENQYLESALAHTKDLQETLFREMTSRIPQEDQTVPYYENGYYYLTRFEEGLEYPIYARKKGTLEAPDEVMLDLNVLAADKAYYQVEDRTVSPDNRILAFGEDTVSRRLYTLRFKNLETGIFLADSIPDTTGLAVWSADNSYVFYTAKDTQTLRGTRIMRHKLGTPASEDIEVFHETDDTFDAQVYKSTSGKYIFILSSQTITKEYRILEADNPLGTFRVFQERIRGLEYHISHGGNQFFIRTNLEAQNFRLMETPEDATDHTHWKEVIPHRENVLLEDLDVFERYLVLSEREKGITQLRVRPHSGDEHYIQFPETVYLAHTASNRDFYSTSLRISYQSLTTPVTVYDYQMDTRTLLLRKQDRIVGGFQPSDYASERIYATVRDGQEVPISIVYKKGYSKDGKQPLLLYGYGSYGFSLDPYFSIARISLLDRGFAFAIAHIRGGEELGRHWYEHGKLLHKMNTFHDFIDCAEFLIGRQYTSREHLYAMGGSAGGLLMGAVVNLRPDLWNGVIAAVPFVDVITTMLDESIPLTTFEYDEWGNPADPNYYAYIRQYSPYDNVSSEQAYPAMLVTTGLHDSQVQYWEPAKWVAKMRQVKSDNNPLYLYTNMSTGHSGASGRFERYREIALEYSFLLDREYPNPPS